MAITGTVGQLLFNASLPKDFRKYDTEISGSTLTGILQDIATKSPEAYKSTLVNIKAFADRAAYLGSGVSLKDFVSPIDHRKIIDDFTKKIPSNASDADVRSSFSELQKTIDDKTLAAALKNNNSMAMQIASGARGNSSQLASTISSAVLYADSFGTPIRIPIRHSFAEGLTSAEYLASTYGTRKGVISTKFATPKGGYFGKQLGYILNTTTITEDDCHTKNGIEADIEDSDNIGRCLAQTAGGVPAGNILTEQLLSDIKKKGTKKILIRSPISCEAEGGICQKCRGLTEQGRLPAIGYNIGQNSAYSLSEPSTQAAMKEKHTGGQVGTAKKPILDALNQLVKVPKYFAGGAVVAEVDGPIKSIERAPQGGFFVTIGTTEHYILPGFELMVKVGDKMEAGMPLSSGVINPADVTRLRGTGEGRRYLADTIRATLATNRIKINKVHSETMSRALISLAQIDGDKVFDDNLPGDIIQFSKAEKMYHPKDVEEIDVKNAEGKFLAKPYMHFTAGTKLKPSMIQTLQSFGMNKISVTEEPAPFNPIMIRVDDVPKFKPSWIGRLFSSNLKKTLLNAAQRTEDSPVHGTDFIPSYITAREFGKPGYGKPVGY